MRAQKYRYPIVVIQSICLLIFLQQCAWLFGEKDPVDLVKPRPIGGYELLGTRVHYPQSVREAGIEGRVVVNVLVSPAGQVLQTKVRESLHPDLDQIVTNAVKRTLFEPATRQGQPEQVWISMPFVFSLKDWSAKKTPFSMFSMTIYPDPAYRNFEVVIQGRLQDEITKPQRIECLLPFNATHSWVGVGAAKSTTTSIVKDDKGEWLIFQVAGDEMSFGFSTKSMEEVFGHKFLYEFTMSQALPKWVLKVVYDSQTVNFSQTPDRTVTLETGETQFEYDFNARETYESSYLEIALQK